MKAADLQKKNEKELTTLLETKRHELWNFRFGASGSKVRNVKEGMGVRREIARILTVLRSMKTDKKA